MPLNTQIFMNRYIRSLMHMKSLASFLAKLGALQRECAFQMHVDSLEQLLSPADQQGLAPTFPTGSEPGRGAELNVT